MNKHAPLPFGFLLFAALGAIHICLAPPLSAATIGHHPGFIPLHGYGIDLRNPDDLKPPVAALDFTQPQFYAGNGSAQFSVYSPSTNSTSPDTSP